MAAVKVTIYEEAIRAILAPSGDAGRYLRSLGEAVATAAAVQAPVDSGRLRASIRTEQDASKVRVIADTPYAAAVHEGAKPHVITPKQARMLRFPTKAGEVVFAPKVNHPGNAPNPFLLRALEMVVRS